MIDVASVLPSFLDACAGATISVVSVLPPFLDASAGVAIGVASVLLPLCGRERRGNE